MYSQVGSTTHSGSSVAHKDDIVNIRVLLHHRIEAPNRTDYQIGNYGRNG